MTHKNDVKMFGEERNRKPIIISVYPLIAFLTAASAHAAMYMWM